MHCGLNFAWASLARGEGHLSGLPGCIIAPCTGASEEVKEKFATIVRRKRKGKQQADAKKDAQKAAAAAKAKAQEEKKRAMLKRGIIEVHTDSFGKTKLVKK